MLILKIVKLIIYLFRIYLESRDDRRNDAESEPIQILTAKGSLPPPVIRINRMTCSVRLHISHMSPQDNQPLHGDLSSSAGSLADNNNLPEKQVGL